MPFGYVGNFPNQQLKNSGIFSPEDVLNLSAVGEYGGSLQLIEEKSISGVSSAIFTDIQEAQYDIHYLQIINAQPVTDGTDIRIRFYESGVEESGSVYDMAYLYNSSGSGSKAEVKSSTSSYLRGTFNIGNASYEAGNSYCYFYDLGNANKYSFQNMHTSVMGNNNALLSAFGGGVLPQTSVVDQIKLYNGSGNFSCIAKLFGVKQI